MTFCQSLCVYVLQLFGGNEIFFNNLSSEDANPWVGAVVNPQNSLPDCGRSPYQFNNSTQNGMKNVECWGLTSFRGEVGLTPKNLPMGLKCYRSKFSDCCNVTHCQIVDQKLSLCRPIPQGVWSTFMVDVASSDIQHSDHPVGPLCILIQLGVKNLFFSDQYELNLEMSSNPSTIEYPCTQVDKQINYKGLNRWHISDKGPQTPFPLSSGSGSIQLLLLNLKYIVEFIRTPGLQT